MKRNCGENGRGSVEPRTARTVGDWDGIASERSGIIDEINVQTWSICEEDGSNLCENW